MAPYNPLGSIPVPPPEGSVNWGGAVRPTLAALAADGDASGEAGDLDA